MRKTESGGYILLTALAFMAIFTTLSVGLINEATVSSRVERASVASAQALALAEAGIDESVYQLNQSSNYAGETDTALGSGTFTTSVAAEGGSTKRITSTGSVPGSSAPVRQRTVKATVTIDTSTVSFHFAIQSGNGGFSMNQSSTIVGNVYSSGPVIGNGGSGTHCNAITGYGNCIFGDVVSAGPSGLVYGITSTSSVWAHSIGNSSVKTTVANNAYYASSIANAYDPTGNPLAAAHEFPGSADQPAAALPIADSQIQAWENQAAAGGTLSSAACDSFDAGSNTCTITSSRIVGPIKIPFNLTAKSSSGVLDVKGPLWVTGNITLQTGPTIKMDPSLGSQNVAIIADNPSNRAGSGVIVIGQSTQFQGSGSAGSFVFMISWNTNAESGGAASGVCGSGSFDAICMSQSSSALVAYASHGQMTFSQSAAVKSATAYKIVLTQSASVTYDTGLPSTLFEAGSGGSWAVQPGTYAITE